MCIGEAATRSGTFYRSLDRYWWNEWRPKECSEHPLVGQSGASSRGNSSTSGLLWRCCR